MVGKKIPCSSIKLTGCVIYRLVVLRWSKCFAFRAYNVHWLWTRVLFALLKRGLRSRSGVSIDSTQELSSRARRVLRGSAVARDLERRARAHERADPRPRRCRDPR